MQCHPFVHPDAYVDMCKEDICSQTDHTARLCEVAEEYASECLSQGVCLQFRQLLNCSQVSCGDNSHYEECGQGCDQTCDAAPCDEGISPVPACYCNQGLVRNNFLLPVSGV